VSRATALAPIREALGRAQPVLIFLAGPNGSGKSTFFNEYLGEPPFQSPTRSFCLTTVLSSSRTA